METLAGVCICGLFGFSPRPREFNAGVTAYRGYWSRGAGGRKLWAEFAAGLR